MAKKNTKDFSKEALDVVGKLQAVYAEQISVMKGGAPWSAEVLVEMITQLGIAIESLGMLHDQINAEIEKSGSDGTKEYINNQGLAAQLPLLKDAFEIEKELLSETKRDFIKLAPALFKLRYPSFVDAMERFQQGFLDKFVESRQSGISETQAEKENSEDKLYEQVRAFVMEKKKDDVVSLSEIQREFKIGQVKTKRLFDRLSQEKILVKSENSGCYSRTDQSTGPDVPSIPEPVISPKPVVVVDIPQEPVLAPSAENANAEQMPVKLNPKLAKVLTMSRGWFVEYNKTLSEILSGMNNPEKSQNTIKYSIEWCDTLSKFLYNSIVFQERNLARSKQEKEFVSKILEQESDLRDGIMHLQAQLSALDTDYNDGMLQNSYNALDDAKRHISGIIDNLSKSQKNKNPVKQIGQELVSATKNLGTLAKKELGAAAKKIKTTAEKFKTAAEKVKDKPKKSSVKKAKTTRTKNPVQEWWAGQKTSDKRMCACVAAGVLVSVAVAVFMSTYDWTKPNDKSVQKTETAPQTESVVENAPEVIIENAEIAVQAPGVKGANGAKEPVVKKDAVKDVAPKKVVTTLSVADQVRKDFQNKNYGRLRDLFDKNPDAAEHLKSLPDSPSKNDLIAYAARQRIINDFNNKNYGRLRNALDQNPELVKYLPDGPGANDLREYAKQVMLRQKYRSGDRD